MARSQEFGNRQLNSRSRRLELVMKLLPLSASDKQTGLLRPVWRTHAVAESPDIIAYPFGFAILGTKFGNFRARGSDHRARGGDHYSTRAEYGQV